MTPALFLEQALRPALQLLPPTMTSPEARAMVLAICLQESKLRHRRQVVIAADGRQVGGPARGYAQFEFVAVAEVLRHPATRPHAVRICEALDVEPVAGTVHAALEYQDVVAAAFARLYLWPVPERLSAAHEGPRAWQQYLRRWGPGQPHPHTWPAHWDHAWEAVSAQP